MKYIWLTAAEKNALNIWDWIPLTITVFSFIGAYFLTRWIVRKRNRNRMGGKMFRQTAMTLLLLLAIIFIVMTVPMSDQKRGQITNLIGIAISAALAISSATVMGNILAGLVLRSINHFAPGDYIEVGNIYGRVSDRGMFHTELQTIDSDLITLPNSYLISQPVKVKRDAGTFVSADVSLGYDVPRKKIEQCLIEAAEKTGLKDAFVKIARLGDFSVSYEIHGQLTDIKKLISTQSLLRAMMLDALHNADIEIVSPTFMNQRPIGDRQFIPPKENKKALAPDPQATSSPEELIFEKAERAETMERRKQMREELDQRKKELTEQLKSAKSDDEEALIQEKIDKTTTLIERIDQRIQTEMKNLKEDK